MRTIVDLGPLGPFHERGVVELADVHVAVGLMRIAEQAIDGNVALAAALCVRAIREGSVCIDIGADPAGMEVEPSHPERLAGSGAAPMAPPELVWPDPSSWLRELRASPLVATDDTARGPGQAARPLRLVGPLVYLARYWEDEQTIREQLRARLRIRADADQQTLLGALEDLFPGAQSGEQRRAAATAAMLGATIIAGGPGTGKTTTVARLVAVLRRCLGPSTTVALAAPTGKAAARMQQAFAEAVATLDPADQRLVGEGSASTLHRLLGAGHPGASGQSGFRHDRGNPLPHDVVVVDEASMVALPLMASLLQALRPDARLILVGDPNQLTSVEVGAVLGDLVHVAAQLAEEGALDIAAPMAERLMIDLPDHAEPAQPSPSHESQAPASKGPSGAHQEHSTVLLDPVVTLRRNWRFGDQIAELATHVLAGDVAATLDLLQNPSDELQFLDTSLPADELAAIESVRRDVIKVERRMREAAQAGDPRTAVAEMDRHRVLCAHRSGRHGVTHWNALIASWIARASRSGSAGALDQHEWYVGRPIIVTVNDHDAGIYNGDTGVTVAVADQLRVALSRGPDPRLIPIARLGDVQTLYAMTVHRGQGSQFERVTVVLPPPQSPLLTRELLYTAITRARSAVRIVGPEASIRQALERGARRASGLRAHPTGA